jgi:hypothetical protein
MSHTPGPWRIGDAGHTVFGPPNGSPSPRTVATVVPHNDRRDNARLIAAAPDLLAVCRSAANWFGELGNDDGAQGLLDDLLAAIAKAEGREE